MKKVKNITLGILSIIGMLIACSSDDSVTVDTTNNDSQGATYNIESILSKFSGTGLSYEISGDRVIFTSQNLPDHTSPYWPTNNPLYEPYNGTNSGFMQNPNTISEQNLVFSIPLNPSQASNNQATSLGPIGIARNGVAFFNQYAGPNNTPLTNEINSFDQWLGHPQQTGQYHYHIEPTYLTDQFGSDALLGILLDGFPVYGPIENGEEITNADLDEFHGHFGPTPDFPEGIYHYHITAEDPYINGSGYYGTPGSVTQ